MKNKLRDIITPEGVVLKIELADPWERAAAVIFDLIMITLVLFAVGLLTKFSGLDAYSPSTSWMIFLLLFFTLRSFYFIFFELRWRGVTPGKRLLGLRVMSRSGGALKGDAIFARNFLREVELFIPLTILTQMQLLNESGFTNIFSLIWLAGFVLLPFFNKDRMRAGDMVGGTWVVRTPKSKLLEDMASTPQRRFVSNIGKITEAGKNSSPNIAFTETQLDIYGIFELQTLENVLRVSGPSVGSTQREVSLRIQKKIGWPANDSEIEPKLFLETFYAALRARLEARMLLGKRRENKFDTN